MAYKLRGVPRSFQTEEQALLFLTHSPGYMKRQEKYLKRFWPGLYAKAAPAAPVPKGGRGAAIGAGARARSAPTVKRRKSVLEQVTGGVEYVGDEIGRLAEGAVSGLGVVSTTGGDPRRIRETQRKTQLQSAGLNERGVLEATRAAGRVAGNFASEATKMALGTPIAPIAFAADPKGFTKGIGQDYYDRYKRLAQGDLSVLADRPASFLADFWATGAIAAKAGAKAGLVKSPSREAAITVDGGQVQRYTSPATLSRKIENAYNRLSERRPDAPVVGAKHRARQRVVTLQERELGHLKQDIVRFSHMAKKVKGQGEQMAFDRLAQYGWRTPQERTQALVLLDGELAQRTRSGKGGRPQARTVKALTLARDHVANPSQHLLDTLEEGFRVMGEVEKAEIALGRLTAPIAEARRNLPASLASGARWEPDSLATLPEGANIVGKIVSPRDRKNIGRVVAFDPESGKATVHFRNRQNRTQAKVDFDLDDLLPTERGAPGRFVFPEGTKAPVTAIERPRTSAEAKRDLTKLEKQVDKALRPLVDQAFPPEARRREQALRLAAQGRGKRASRAAQVKLEMEGIGTGRSVLADAQARVEQQVIEMAARPDAPPQVRQMADLIAQRDEMRAVPGREFLGEAGDAPYGTVTEERVLAGESAFYLPHTSQGPIKSLAQPARSLNQPKRHKRTQGILFTEGRTRYGPKLVTEAALKSARQRVILVNIDHVKRDWAKPWKPGEEVPEGWVIWNPEGVTLPRAARDTFADDPALTPKEVAQMMAGDYNQMVDNMFPSQAYAGKPAFIIPEWVGQAFRSGQMRMPKYGTDGLYAAIENVVNLSNNLFRLRIYVKPSYLTNFFANEAAAIYKQGPWHIPNLKQSIQALSSLDARTLARFDELGGTSASVALEGPAGGRGPLGGLTTAIGQVANRITDKTPRRTAVTHEVRKALKERGEKLTDENANRLLDDPDSRARLNTVMEEAQNSMGRFEGLGPMEREYLTTWIAVYPWLKAATRWTVRMPWDTPVRAAVVAHAGLEGYEWAGEQLGEVAHFLRKYVPIPWEDAGEGKKPVRNLGALTPLSTGMDVYGGVASAVLGSDRVGETTRLGQLLSPPVAALAQGALGVNPFGQTSGKGLVDTLVGQTHEGGLPRTVKELVSPTGETRYFGDRGRRGTVEQFVAGPLARRDLKTAQARKEGMEESLADRDPKERAYIRELRAEQAKAKKVGIQLPRFVVEDLLRKAELDGQLDELEREARRKGKKITYRTRLAVLGEFLGVGDFGAKVLPEKTAEKLYDEYRDYAYPGLAQWRELVSGASP